MFHDVASRDAPAGQQSGEEDRGACSSAPEALPAGSDPERSRDASWCTLAVVDGHPQMHAHVQMAISMVLLFVALQTADGHQRHVHAQGHHDGSLCMLGPPSMPL